MRNTSIPQSGEKALDTMRYRTVETVQISGDFQKRQCRLCKGAGETIFKREKKMYLKTKYQNKIIQ